MLWTCKAENKFSLPLVHIYSWSAVEELRIVALIMAQNSCKCAEVVLKKILHRTTEIVLHKHFTESTNVIKMTHGWLFDNGEWNAFAVAVNKDNTIVIALKTIISNHLRPLFFFFFTSTLFTEIQTWYQIQPNYKSLVNLPKTLLIQHRPTHTIWPKNVLF